MGAGRPRELTEPQNFTIRVERSLIEKARAAAEAKGVTLSDVVRAALENLAGDRRPRPRRSKTSRS